ncbi:MAG: VWA domain-containing protein [Arenicellales bacterium]|nr:VWA domain-containing protein [Arenicellales bacterium]
MVHSVWSERVDDMIHFEWVWVFLFLPLPLLARLTLSPAQSERDAALRAPFIDDFERIRDPRSIRSGSWWTVLVAIIIWLLLIVAAARPQWIGDPIELPVSGRDLMLAVDLSGSMEARDFELNGQAVDRLTATKSVAGEFIQRREGDRLGLILFGENAYLQTPLTFDRATVHTLLMESVIGLAGKKTAIGDAIGLAVKRLQESAGESRVLILLTDGANTAGEISPLKAAELAANTGLKIYTIGVGADEIIVQSLLGHRRINPSQDLDEKTLRAIAEETNARYFRARSTDELEEIYKLLDELEPVEAETHHFRPTVALFYWPLAIALLLTALLIVTRNLGGRGL